MWAEGAASGTEVGLTLALAMSAVGMAAVPFAMKKAGNVGFWLVCFVMGLGLATFNYTMAVELASKWRDHNTSPAAVKQLKSAALDSRITQATAALERLPQVPHTTAAMVTAAKLVAGTAATWREEECRKRGGRGDQCRDREKDEREALKALSTAEANRATTLERERLDAELKVASREKVELGPVPHEVDPAAARIGKVLATFFELGPRPDLVVIDWWPTFVAVVIEAIGLLMPRIILTATGHADVPAPRAWRVGLGSWRHRRRAETDVAPTPASVSTSPAAPAATVKAATVSATVPRGAATDARPKKPSKSASAAVADADTVLQWQRSRTIARSGSRLKPRETYDTSYVPFCKERGLEPVSFTRFGMVVKAPTTEGGCGFGFERTPSKRDHYLDVALVSAPKLVAQA
jgi:hypothetical protein